MVTRKRIMWRDTPSADARYAIASLVRVYAYLTKTFYTYSYPRPNPGLIARFDLVLYGT